MTPDSLSYYPRRGSPAIGRYCELEGTKEVTDLKAGMDFRHPKYRREVFLRFYEFHLKFRSHPGAVYQMFPAVFETLSLTPEQKLWFAFINGDTQHVVTTLTIFRRFPDLEKLSLKSLERYFTENYGKFGWDTDRRYHKKEFLQSVKVYREPVGDNGQINFFSQITRRGDEEASFRLLWDAVRKSFWGFGRLSTFSYLEYLRLSGVKNDCGNLLLEDMSGSKSHRNGLSKVLGRDDLDWHKSGSFRGAYAPGQLDWLREEAALLRSEAKERFRSRDFVKDVGYFTLESALCTYKSWHRPNRRYPNVYNDMFYLRLKDAEKAFPAEDYSVLWEARRKMLPKYLRLEDSPLDPGLCRLKQNHYRLTGQVIMMDKTWPCFKNDFSKEVLRWT